MDTRFLYSSLMASAVGFVLSPIIYDLALAQAAFPTMVVFLEIATSVLVLTVATSVVLMVVGFFRKRPFNRRQAGKLGISSFGLGIFALLLTFGSSLGLADDAAACGGFPTGYWTGPNATVNRCSIFVSAHPDWIVSSYGLGLVVCTVIFLTCVFTRLRIDMVREREIRAPNLEASR